VGKLSLSILAIGYTEGINIGTSRRGGDYLLRTFTVSGPISFGLREARTGRELLHKEGGKGRD